MKRLVRIVAVAFSVVAVMIPSSAAAGDTSCTGALTGTFDNVVVPEGAECVLTDSTVRGNVKALQDSRLFMENDTVGGNVEGDKASSVQVSASTVLGNIHIVEAHDPDIVSAAVYNSILPKGNIQIEKGRAQLGDWGVFGNELRRGNIKVEENNTTFFSSISANTVGGNVQVFKNTGSGEKAVVLNEIRGNLQCKENQEPFVGQPNVVGGHAEDQCAGDGVSASSLSGTLQASGVPLRKHGR